MKTLYQRNFMVMAGVILLSFALLGGVFITLSYQYTLGEQQQNLEDNARYIAQSFVQGQINTSTGVLGQKNDYTNNIDTLASISNSYIIVTEKDGSVFYASDGQGGSDLSGGKLPTQVVQTVVAEGSYSGMTDLGGLLEESHFVAGTPMYITVMRYQDEVGLVQESVLCGTIFVAAQSGNITEMWRAFATIFFFTAVVVLFIAFISSSVTSMWQTKPLKEIADATRQFGHGDFEVRVKGMENRKDEVGELAVAFNAMADTLAKSEAQRSEFVANISHELKTPMTTIAGFADGILDGTIPAERGTDALKTISSETRRLSRLVRRMLDLSRLQSTEQINAQERFDAGETLLRVLVSLEGKITARHLDVDAHFPEEAVHVWGDQDAVTQVCYNLLDNAIKFSAEGEMLGVTLTTRDCKAFITIRNVGEGIPPEELPLVFDRFHKTDRSRSVDREGVGLGLYIVKTILDTHKEDIAVTSEGGVTQFSFTLTLA